MRYVETCCWMQQGWLRLGWTKWMTPGGQHLMEGDGWTVYHPALGMESAVPLHASSDGGDAVHAQPGDSTVACDGVWEKRGGCAAQNAARSVPSMAAPL
jgi:hypothetical protein